MKIEIVPCLNDNYSYLICDNETNTISIVDPSQFDECDKIIKKYNKLDFILNTHHHSDHVDGNTKLKEKYKSKIIGFENDKDRIPGIDISLKDNQKFKIGFFEFRIIFIPGHTKGHVAFYFEKEKILFSGDTLFSLGCGRIFEGTNKDMFESLKKLKNLTPETKIYCGHEYTKKNLDFCLKYDRNNSKLREREKSINLKLENQLPTVPAILKDELETNIFLRCENNELKRTLNMKGCSDLEIFTKLRDLKDNF